MKGIILAGGTGSRLFPVTLATCKQLLPIYDKPMIYYPLSVLIQAGIREILIISTPQDLSRFQALFGDGNHLGLSISYQVQDEPSGIAQAFILGASFIGNDSVALVLGDNIFYGERLSEILTESASLKTGGIVLGYEVRDPERYGVVAFDDDCHVTDIIEKPQTPPSNYAVTGLYFYDNNVIEYAKQLKPSPRGELEITDLNKLYLRDNALQVRLLGQGFAWLDTGTHDALLQASNFVQTIQERQGLKIACIEEIAYKKGFITLDQLMVLAEKQSNSEYGNYLERISSCLGMPTR